MSEIRRHDRRPGHEGCPPCTEWDESYLPTHEAPGRWAPSPTSTRDFDGWVMVSPGSAAQLSGKDAEAFEHGVLRAAQVVGFSRVQALPAERFAGSPEWDLRRPCGRSRDGRFLTAWSIAQVAGLPRSSRSASVTSDADGCCRRRALRSPGARAQNARVLLETTTLTSADIAYASGFSSVRQFNATMQEIFAATPGELRRAPRDERFSPRGARLSSPGVAANISCIVALN